MSIHIGEKPYMCNKCGNIFVSNINFLNHIPIHTGEIIYHWKYYYHYSNIHFGERPYQCSNCGEAFLQNECFSWFMKMCRWEKAFYFNIFNIFNTNYKNISCYIWVHTGDRPCQCNLCGKVFIHVFTVFIFLRFIIEECSYHCCNRGTFYTYGNNFIIVNSKNIMSYYCYLHA